MQLKPGSLNCGGKYRREKVLGQGGFGITYLAEQTSLGRRVALKEFFMKEHCDRETSTSYVTVPSAGSRELVERFRQKFIKEARQIATFENSHIVRVIDVFEDNGTAYYVMDYLDGKSLEAIVREQGSLAEADAVKYIRNIADALSEVHARNFLHLDVKPANVMLNKNGEAVLIDFGISKHYDDSGNQTSSGLMAFSDGYAPLEQYNRGGLSDFTPAIDIYALGATMFKLLTGMTPPHASVINNDGLPVLPQEISPAVRNAVETAMQPRRKDRPQSIADFLALLDKEEKAAVLPVNDGATAFVKPAADAATVIGKPSADAATAIGKPADNDATVVKQPASKETVPPPATKEAQSPAKQGESKGNGVGKWLFLFILLLAVIAGAVWYVTNGSGGNDNGANGGNTMKETVKETVVDDVVLVPYIDENGKIGFIDKSGNEVVPCKYDWAYGFSEGLALVRLGGKWGFIDKSGNEVVPCKYDYADIFSEGLAYVELDGKYGFIDKSGNEVISCKYDGAISFSEGLAIVYLDGKFGFIDKSGNEVVPCKYDYAYGFSEGLARVELDDKWGFIDKSGNVVIQCKYDEARSFSEGLASVKLDGKWGFIDKSGNVVIPFKYDGAGSFSKGLAIVYLDGREFYIDKSGNEIK